MPRATLASYQRRAGPALSVRWSIAASNRKAATSQSTRRLPRLALPYSPAHGGPARQEPVTGSEASSASTSSTSACAACTQPTTTLRRRSPAAEPVSSARGESDPRSSMELAGLEPATSWVRCGNAMVRGRPDYRL
jgi:hypothetical protein